MLNCRRIPHLDSRPDPVRHLPSTTSSRQSPSSVVKSDFRPSFRRDGQNARSGAVRPHLSTAARHCGTGPCFDRIRRRDWSLSDSLAGDPPQSHPHRLLTPHVSLSKLLGSLKGATDKRANLVLRRTGQPFWQDESYAIWF